MTASSIADASEERPLRCLHYLDAFHVERGGVVRAVLDLVGGLAAAGVSMKVVTGDPADIPADWRTPGGGAGTPRVEVIDRRVTPLFHARCDPDTLARLVVDVDVVHLHTPWDPFNRPLAAAATQAGKPYLMTTHGMLDDWCLASKAFKKHAYLSLGGRTLLRNAAALHFTAESEAAQSMRRVPGAKSIVIPLALDTRPFRELVGAEAARAAYPDAFADEAPRLLFVGRVHPIKGLDTLIDALAKLKAEGGPQAHLLIAGPADDEYADQFRARVTNAGLDDRVHLLGMVEGEVKQSLYQAADAFVLPSHHESFGIALAEAMMCGSAVLTTRGVNVWPEIEKFGGLVVEHTVAELTSGLEELLTHLPDRKATAAANRQTVLDWVDQHRVTQQYIAAYRAAIRGEL
ncbi:MAG: glycosyltransferase [Planctomycetota bacterium]